MQTQQQIQPSQLAGGGISTTTTAQHWAETAVIGDNTRRLLIIWGKLNDAANEYADLISEIYGSQADQMLEPFMENFSKVSDEVLNTIPVFIIESREVYQGNRAEI